MGQKHLTKTHREIEVFFDTFATNALGNVLFMVKNALFQHFPA